MNRTHIALCAALATVACKKSRPDASEATASASAAAASATTAPIASTASRPPVPVPTGPVLAILRGQGVGPIRFGATVPTIERLMGLPCGVRTEHSCQYPPQALEFLLDETGATTEVHVYSLHQPMGERETGMFNGRFPSGLNLGMIRDAVIELEGPPVRAEKMEDGGRLGIVERLHYDDMRVDLQKQSDGDTAIVRIALFAAKRQPSPAGTAR